MSTQDPRKGQKHTSRPLGKGLGVALATPNGPSAGDSSECEPAEVALRRAELRCRLLFEQAPVMYVITGNEHGAPIIIDCNEVFLTTLGYDSRADVLGRPLGDFYAPPSRAELLEHGGFQRALEGRFIAEERQLVTRDGRLVETMLRAVPELDADGRTIGTRAMYVDITERKRAEQALRESEERFRLIAGTTSDVIWDSDLTTGRVWRSEGMQRLFGYGPGQEDPRMMWWSERIHPEDRERVVSGIYGAITGGGEAWFGEYRFRRADGSYAYVHDRSYVIRDGDGRPVRLIGGITDITERKRAEAALRESERRYRLLAEGATDIIWIRDVNLRTTYVNAAVTRIRGYSVEEVMAQSLAQVLTPASLKLARKAFAEELAQGAVQRDLSWRRTLELEATCKDGSTVWLDTQVTALRDENWRVAGVLGVSRDITDRKRAEEALQETREELESRVERRMRQGSAYGLTFRELTVLHLVTAGKSDKEIASTLGISALTASKHLGNILHKMGAVSRTEAGVRAVREGLLD